MDYSIPGFPVPYHLPEFAQVHVHWISDPIQPCHPLSPSSLSAFNLSQHQGLFQWVSSLHEVAKVSEIQLQHQFFSEYSGLLSFIQGWLTGLISLLSKRLKSLLQHYSWQVSILWHSAFFMVQPSHPYMTTGKTIALTMKTFVGKVMYLLLNMLSRFVVSFLPKGIF